MRAVAFLLTLCLAGYVSSQQQGWKAGQQYVYGVRSRLFTTGASNINNQYSGIQVEYQVTITVTGPNTLHLNPENVKAVELNGELEGGWRDGELQNETPAEISEQLRKYLESPMELKMRQGVVESINVENYLPTWAVNIKKAQASYFVADTTGVNVVMRGNMNRKTNSVRPEEANQESGFFYETMEETIHGECETYYTVSQNGPFDWPYQFQQQQQPGQRNDQDAQSQEQNSNHNSNESNENDNNNSGSSDENIRRHHQYVAYKKLVQRIDSASAEDSHETNQGELPWPKAFASFCQQHDQVYEIVKAVNFTACKQKPILAYTTSPYVFGRGGDNSVGSAMNRALVTRYLACGKDRKQFTILKIEQEEQVNAGIRLDQKTLAGTIQNITLWSVGQASQVEQLQHAKNIKGLSYTFDPKEQKLQREGRLRNSYSDDYNQNAEDENQESDENEQSTPNPNSKQSDSNESKQLDDGPQQRHKQGSYKKNRVPRSVSDRHGHQQSQEDKYENQKRNQKQDSQEQSKEQAYQTYAENSGPLPQPDMQTPPINPLLVSPLQVSGMIKRVQELMQEIQVDILENKQSMAEAETLSKISTVCKIIRQLNYSQIMDLYHLIASKQQSEADQTNRSVLLDSISMAGTNPAMAVLTDLIKKREIVGEEAAQIIMTYPLYVRTPTKQLMQHIFKNLVDSPDVEHTLQVKTTAVLSFSNLVYQAWVDSRIKNSRYPVALYGEFGNQNDAQKYAQYFVKQAKQYLQKEQSEGHNKHWSITYLKALGNLGTPEIIQVVQKVLDDSNDPYIKTNAVFALSRVVISRSAENVPVNAVHSVDRPGQEYLTDEVVEKQVLPILVSAAFDKGEHPEPRMAAISLLLFTTNADVAIWQQLAYSTWFESSQEVHAFVYSSLKSLANVDQSGAQGALHTMTRRARAVLSLAKPSTTNFAKSRNHFYAGFAEHLQSSYSHQFSYFGSKDSNAPNLFYYRNYVQLGNSGVGATPFQFSAYGHTIQKLFSLTVAQFQQESTQDSEFYENHKNVSPHEQDQNENQQIHKDLQQIIQQLQIERRDQEEDIEGSIDFKIRNEMQRLFSVSEEDIQNFVKYVKANYLPKLLTTGIPINYQKTYHAAEHLFEMPSAMGVPITYNFQMPVHVSFRGNIRAVVNNGMQIQAELHAVYAYKAHTRISFKVPFTGKKYQSGIQRHFVAELPLRVLARKGLQGQYVVAITPSQLGQSTPSGQIPLATYHQKPYTAIITDSLWPTTHKEGGQMTIIHTHAAGAETPFKRQVTFGQESFGLSFEVQEESEYPEQNEGQSGWIKFWQRFHSQSCYFNLGWLGGKNIRYVERTLMLDVSKSETKTLAFVFAGQYQQSASSKDLWQDSKSTSSQSSEESSGSNQRKSSRQQNSNEQDNQSRQVPHKGRQYAAGSEDFPETINGGYIVSAAIIGKRTPIRAIGQGQGQIQNILQKGSRSTVQYFVQFSKSSGRVYIRAATGDAANEAAKSLPQSSKSLQAIREAIIESENTKSQPNGCAEFEGEYDAPKWANRGELLVLRKRLLAEPLAVQVKAELQFGRGCSKTNMPYEIKVRGKLERGPKMTEYAQSISRKAKQCAEDEKKGFSVSPVCIEVAVHQAAALNKGDFKITFSQMPDQFVNRTDDIEDFGKALLYPYMSSNRYHEGAGNNSTRVEYLLTPNRQFIDVHITKPNSKLSFQGIQTNRAIRAFLPFTATQSLANNMRDRALRSDSDPSCSLENNYVSTFDNVTYRFNQQAAQNCYHLLAQDCSRREQVAVLYKDVGTNQKKVVILLEARTKIELTPPEWSQRPGLLGASKVQVQINEKRVESLPRVIRDKNTNQVIARIEATNEGGVQVFSNFVDVGTNGKYVIVYGSNALRNRTCGMCGDFNGEKSGEMKSPKNCPLSSPSAFYASYALQPINDKEGQCKVQPQYTKQIGRENNNCQNDAGYNPQTPKYGKNIENQNNVLSSEETPACMDDIISVTKKQVFYMANTLLKSYIWNSMKRHTYANQIADKATQQVAQLMKEESLEKMAKDISKTTCNVLRSIPQRGSRSGAYLQGLCNVVSPLLSKSIINAVNPICQTSNCCKPFNKVNHAEIEQQLEYIIDDSGESEEDSIPYIKRKDHEQPCSEQLEEFLPSTIAKVAYMALEADAHLGEKERQQSSEKVAQEVKEEIKKAWTSGNRLVQHVSEAFVRSAPSSIQHAFKKTVEDITQQTIRNFQDASQCVFQNHAKNQNQD